VILLVTGGRDFCEAVTSSGEPRDRDLYMNERRALGYALDFLKPSAVIVGDATGADRWAKIWCDKRSVPCQIFKADWSLGKRAGPERNQRMVDKRPDAAVRFSGGRGTQDCAHRCDVAGIDVFDVVVR
jgi:YspA, cpYpsA-related SLOG family